MYDFCINGGGMVGSSLALGLVQQGYKVVILESAMPEPFDTHQPPDLRLSAISLASCQLLEKLGAWSYIQQYRVKAYDQLSVWENPTMAASFDAASIQQSHLGYFVENRLIQLGCYAALENQDVTWIKENRLVGYTCNDNGVTLTLEKGNTVTSRYLIGADGARSRVRALAGIGTSGWQYQQQAMGIIIKSATPSKGETWQQFFPSGPRAYLPMYDNYGSLIWYDSPQRINQLCGLPPEQLKAQVLAHFPQRLDDFEVLDKAAFPLTRSHATRYIQPGVILIGDAAHTINPLAGQGVNLGFKDVSALLAITATSKPDEPSFYQHLSQDYARPRRQDNLRMMSAMDGFYALFSNQIPPLKMIRNLLLKGADISGPLKVGLLKHAIGMDEWKF
ncbi:FAD-dependent monooxygenase [Alteromonas sp. C1M14]|uniref:FAD-dependent monooxygenase n=1 Tax=Alteromonas sp. C1M14 TaxID=2841567 RepID=UPI001C0A0142|nr:FAD-dependent monooxygenase [Alteromonas sp. C1M14]MBU2978863.1 FAD-dependent monooxygenase [Alteromonas sp. C1M14]